MHAHIKALYEHLRWVYPLADAEATVDAVFAEAARLIQSIPHSHPRSWLFGLARKILLLSNSGDEWQQRNAAAVIDSLRETASHMQDWHLWSDTDRVIAATEHWSISDQEVIRFISCVEGVDADSLAVILDLSVANASQLLNRLIERFCAACADAEPTGDATYGDKP